MSDERPAPRTSGNADLLVEYLAERDVPCPRCGYNLRALTGRHCPECGDSLRLQVGLTYPHLGPYIALLAACCLGLGGSALFGLIALFNAPSSWWREPSAWIMLGQLVIAGSLLPLVLTRRTHLRARPLPVQWFLAVAMWLIVVGLSTGVVALF